MAKLNKKKMMATAKPRLDENKGVKKDNAAVDDSDCSVDREEEMKILEEFKRRQAELIQADKKNQTKGNDKPEKKNETKEKSKKQKKKDKKLNNPKKMEEEEEALDSETIPVTKQAKTRKEKSEPIGKLNMDKKTAKKIKIVEEPDDKTGTALKLKKRKPSKTERELARKEKNLKKKLRKIKRLAKKEVTKSPNSDDDEGGNSDSDEEIPDFGSDSDPSSYEEDHDDKVIQSFWAKVGKEDGKKPKNNQANKTANKKPTQNIKISKVDEKTTGSDDEETKTAEAKVKELEDKIAVLENKRQAKALQRKSKPKLSKAERKKVKEEKQKKYKLKKFRKLAAKKEKKKLEEAANKSLTEDKKQLKPEIKSITNTANVFNPEGKLLFSKIEFPPAEKKKKGLDTNPKKLLEDLTKQKEKLKELTEAGDTEKATELKRKMALDKALSKIEGRKIKDDPELLKKSIKRRDKRKDNTKKKWQEREQKVAAQKEKRLKKRQGNIEKRQKQKKTKKLKKLAKKGKIIPGVN